MPSPCGAAAAPSQWGEFQGWKAVANWAVPLYRLLAALRFLQRQVRSWA